MHFFKLFLAGSFAVSAAIKALVTLLATHQGLAGWQGFSHHTTISIASGIASLMAGALIAKGLRRKPIRKSVHG